MSLWSPAGFICDRRRKSKTKFSASYSFKQASQSAAVVALEKRLREKSFGAVNARRWCLRAQTNLAASVDVEQTNSTGQLLGILDAVPQNTGGEIQGAFIRLRTHKHTQIHKVNLLLAAGRGVFICVLVTTAHRASLLTSNISPSKFAGL